MNTIRVKRSTTYTLEHEGQEFELTFEPCPDSEIVKINKRKKTAEIRYLVQDEDSAGDYWKDRDEGEFRCADPRSSWYRPMDSDELEELRKENPGRVFLINKFEHGNILFYRQGTGSGSYPYNCPWDNSRGYAVYIAPEDATDPKRYCDSAMKEFSAWCNGEIYGCSLDRYTFDGEHWKLVDNDACWGYIGSDWAMEALKTFPD